MTTKDINDLTSYSYQELEQTKQLMQMPAIAQAFPFSTKDIDAEIERRSAPKEEANPESTNPQKEEDGEQEGVSV